jgi:peptide/nickel transport system permease protein
MSFIKKILSSVFVILGVVVLVFILFQYFGDPAKMIAGQTGDKKTMDNIRKELNLDQPKWKQLLIYVNDISPIGIYKKEVIAQKKINGLFIGNDIQLGIKIPYLGKSYQTKKAVTTMLWEALPGTIILAITAMLIACLLGITIGIIAAIYKHTWIDNTSIISSIAGVSAPSFFMAVLIAYVFGILLHQFTGLNFTGSLYSINEITGKEELQLKNIILPAITLGIRPMAMIMQLTRSSMLDVMGQDYIRTAYAKGLTRNQVIFNHGLKNAMNPIVTAITGWFGELLAGAFFVEFIFGWQGLGKLTIEALDKLDYPVVMGAVVLSSLIFIIINILSDLLLQNIDTRISN